ncbi:MAG TPA: glycosyltransferase family 2 protein [Pedobacter sp.]|jgi:hypothetical protein
MKVSVCIPTFNQELFIEQAIRSAAEQTLPPIEIIVSDDCSTDQTGIILEKLSAEIPILKVIYQAKNLGISKNTDTCLRSASGEIIVRLDSDDYLSLDYIQTLTDILVKHPSAGYAHGAVQEVDKNGRFLHKRTLIRKGGFQSGDDALKATLKGYRVAANIIMFRKSALEKVDYLTGRPNFGEDYHLTAAISAAGFGNAYVDAILSYYRVWVDAGKVRQKRKLDEIIGIRKVFEEVIEPGFRKRGWNLREVDKSRESFACVHADCLGWSVYNSVEKAELLNELNNLSSTRKSRIYALIYFSQIGGIFSAVLNKKRELTRVLKAVISSLK